MMKAVNGCTVIRSATGIDIVRFNMNRSGFCLATDKVCKDLNAKSSSSNGRFCDCQCSRDRATFLEGDNVCSKNQDVHYGKLNFFSTFVY